MLEAVIMGVGWSTILILMMVIMNYHDDDDDGDNGRWIEHHLTEVALRRQRGRGTLHPPELFILRTFSPN